MTPAKIVKSAIERQAPGIKATIRARTRWTDVTVDERAIPSNHLATVSVIGNDVASRWSWIVSGQRADAVRRMLIDAGLGAHERGARNVGGSNRAGTRWTMKQINALAISRGFSPFVDGEDGTRVARLGWSGLRMDLPEHWIDLQKDGSWSAWRTPSNNPPRSGGTYTGGKGLASLAAHLEGFPGTANRSGGRVNRTGATRSRRNRSGSEIDHRKAERAAAMAGREMGIDINGTAHGAAWLVDEYAFHSHEEAHGSNEPWNWGNIQSYVAQQDLYLTDDEAKEAARIMEDAMVRGGLYEPPKPKAKRATRKR